MVDGRKFASSEGVGDDAMSKATYGLQTREEFAAAAAAAAASENNVASLSANAVLKEKNKKKKKKKKRKAASMLSFDLREEYGGEEMTNAPPKKIMKNPDIDTHFLPDQERDEAQAAKVKMLKEEWIALKDKIEKEMVEVT